MTILTHTLEITSKTAYSWNIENRFMFMFSISVSSTGERLRIQVFQSTNIVIFLHVYVYFFVCSKLVQLVQLLFQHLQVYFFPAFSNLKNYLLTTKTTEQTTQQKKENACISLKLKRIINAYYASIGGIYCHTVFIFVGVALVL